MLRSFKVALVTIAACWTAWLLPFVGIWPPSPWDIAAFTAVSLAMPFGGLAVTLVFVGRELPKPWGHAKPTSSAPWQSVVVATLVPASNRADVAVDGPRGAILRGDRGRGCPYCERRGLHRASHRRGTRTS